MAWSHFLNSKKSCMYPFWSILKIYFLQVISHLMIVLAFLKAFILNFFISWSFYYFNTCELWDLRIKSFIYMPIIMNFLFHFMVKMYVFALMKVKPIFQKNLVIVLFQSLSTCFNSYKFFNILYTSLFWLTKYLWEISI